VAPDARRPHEGVAVGAVLLADFQQS